MNRAFLRTQYNSYMTKAQGNSLRNNKSVCCLHNNEKLIRVNLPKQNPAKSAHCNAKTDSHIVPSHRLEKCKWEVGFLKQIYNTYRT